MEPHEKLGVSRLVKSICSLWTGEKTLMSFISIECCVADRCLHPYFLCVASPRTTGAWIVSNEHEAIAEFMHAAWLVRELFNRINQVFASQTIERLVVRKMNDHQLTSNLNLITGQVSRLGACQQRSNPILRDSPSSKTLRKAKGFPKQLASSVTPLLCQSDY